MDDLIARAAALGRLNAMMLPQAVASGTSDQVIGLLALLPAWMPDGDYTDKTNQAYTYNGYPYRCGVPHRAADYPDQTPETLPALWWPLHGTTVETVLPWRQPLGAHDMYKQGEMMVWHGVVMRCVSDTAYSPEDYAQAWEAAVPVVVNDTQPEDYDEGGETEGGSATEDTPTQEYPAWEPWDFNNDHLYRFGVRVTHNGKVWESTADNNHWEPGTVGAPWVEVVP